MYLKLSAIGVISCRGELYVCEIEWQLVSSPVEESWSPVEENWVCLKLTAIGVVSCRGELDVCEMDSNWLKSSSLVHHSCGSD